MIVAPSAGTPVGVRHFARAIVKLASANEQFANEIKKLTSAGHCFFANSGTTAFHLMLEAMKRASGRKEVVLPAYTAPSLILPILRSGLRPKLCDISLDTFNLDPREAASAVGPETLALVAVHMFGIPCDMDELRKIAKGCGAFLIEDAASAAGSRYGGKAAGSLGDVGFFSFNRGKNLSTLCGGCIMTDDEVLAKLMREEVDGLPELGILGGFEVALKLLALAMAVRPLVYTVFYKIIQKHKYTALHEDFHSARYARFQAALGAALLGSAEKLFEARCQNGEFLMRSMSGMKGIRMPRPLDNSRPVYNQFPILLEDPQHRDSAVEALLRGGIEATTLYPEPIHRACDLGYDRSRDPFPRSTYLSRRLLLIPTHPMMGRKRLQRAVDILAASLGGRYAA